MREGKFANFLGGALTLLSAVAHAGFAPKELYGKSVTVAWTENRTQTHESEQLVRNSASAVQMNIYISTAGRPFARVISSGIAGHNFHEQLPPPYEPYGSGPR
jgi:hypothetical protein